MAESETPPRSYPPIITDGTKVLSRRTSPGHGGMGEATKMAPEGNTSAAEDMGGAIPIATDMVGYLTSPAPNKMPFRGPL